MSQRRDMSVHPLPFAASSLIDPLSDNDYGPALPGRWPATVTHSPTLRREANPVLRRLLNNGVALEWVFLFGGIMQILFVSLTMVLWLGLLKHRHTLAATMPPSGSLLEYFKAGTGGRKLSY